MTEQGVMPEQGDDGQTRKGVMTEQGDDGRARAVDDSRG